MTSGLWWLPEDPAWKEKLKAAQASGEWAQFVALANTRMDFVRTVQLDRKLPAPEPGGVPQGCKFASVRLAILSSCTVDQLLPGLRVAAVRRGFWLETYVCDYGQYQQELLDENSGLTRFNPDVVLFAFDAVHLVGNAVLMDDPDAVLDATLGRIANLWRLARDRFGCQVIQQALLPVIDPLMGSNEHRLAGSPHRGVTKINAAFRNWGEAERVDILALDAAAARSGIDAWHAPSLWHSAKQDISPVAAPLYGDLVLRLVAGRRGRSAKCLALDLDNTLWGGVIGDDGLDGIVLGQGSAGGEAYAQFQRYVKNLSQRGIILAVCSKNDEKNALAPFNEHPEMLLKAGDISCFVANWNDKPSNLREIARRLNIGIDAIVFADDNPFERNIVRRELPMVMVPELPEDPALYSRCIADAGYFEALEITGEDLLRTRNYQSEKAREQLRETVTDMAGYLQSLEMQMVWKPFDKVGLQRIVQLINKTNQFNLTTRRYTEAEVAALLDRPDVICLQLRLTDKFGDHGVIGIVIGEFTSADNLDVQTWLMSCRVLGRGVEEATANLLCQLATARGARTLTGHYRPTEKNDMVRQHFAKLGFDKTSESPKGATDWLLSVADYASKDTFIEIVEGGVER